MRMVGALILVFLPACGDGKAKCDAAKDAAHQAWGELGVRVGLEVSSRRDERKEREGRLAAAQRHAKDAPPGALDGLKAEIAQKKAAEDAAQAQQDAADKVRDAWRSATAAHAQQLGADMLAQFAGLEAEKASIAGVDAVSVCTGIEK